MEEVHLWRGSAEPRARRSHLHKSDQFAYVDRQLDYPYWSGLVLDFGGNAGRLLLDPTCRIRHEDYCCIDVLREAVEDGRKRLPRDRAGGWQLAQSRRQPARWRTARPTRICWRRLAAIHNRSCAGFQRC